MTCYNERRSIILWLISQEQALSVWLDQVMASPGEPDLVEKLEKHRRWLVRAIRELEGGA
ncbi:hypothetical protein [Amphiplicatus metriothermophilus]|uniref:Uncharacterized protein n=1 Tax=Amphiplicatus metriothermophilus TaxID=1519374 RepID=A0A239PZU5_9PROT|nr:hypothetical protein [Amphiplicatus metriothermophilus]MBB5518260.1 hypothetical protein [Amphiplicatus metriothermophilus]SNT75486.1 hypothetical protein SAMN06297382_2764 [Amphiplicatus metriothermophilus]